MSNYRKTFFHCSFLLASMVFVVTNAFALNLSKALTHPGFNPSHTSIAVIDINTGKLIAEHNPNMALNPASCMKIVTSSTALAKLGPDYKFKTNFYSEGGSGASIDKIYIQGSGDPFLVNEEIERISAEIKQRGIKRITGGIVADDYFFDSNDFPKKAGNEGRSYSAMVSALAVNFNSAEVVVSGAGKSGKPSAEIFPPIDYIKVVNKLRTGKRFTVSIVSRQDANGETFTVQGTVPARLQKQSVYKPVRNPALYAGSIFKYWLTQNGIQVTGKVTHGKVPQDAKLIAVGESLPLTEIVQKMNKVSNNFIAEQLTKHLGGVVYGAPASTEKGIRVYEDYLSELGVARNSYALENGSGLSDNTSVTAHQLAHILAIAYSDKKIRDAFIESLPVFGVDGTTKRWKFAPSLIGVARAKTGTLNGVSTLAGYVPMKNGHTAAFAILANGLKKGAWNAHLAQAEVVKIIAEAVQ